VSNGTTFEAAPKREHDPFAPKQPDVCSPEPQGRLGAVWPIVIPEQVVGSVHQFEFPAPRNLSPLGAFGVVSMDGSGDLKAGWGVPAAVPGMGTGPLRVTYAPTSAGVQRSTLTLVMKWEDGHVEQRTIQVVAQARSLNDLTASEVAIRQANREQPKPAVEQKAPDRNIGYNGTESWNNVTAAYLQLMGEQRGGIDLVERESQKFKPKPAERSAWEDIAELAFQLGTGAIGGLVAKFVASRVSKALVDAERLAKVAKDGEAGIAAAEKVALAAKGSPVDSRLADQEVIAKKVDNYANKTAAAHAAFAEGEVSSLTSAAVSKVFSSVASEIRGLSASGAGAATAPASADAVLAFFSEQFSMNRALERTGRERLNAVIAEQGKRHPDIAPQIMTGIAHGFDDAVDAQAKQKQAAITSAQFMTYLARTSLGTETIDTPHGSEVVTDMSLQRSHGDSVLEPAPLSAGVLEIACDYQYGGNVRVYDARANQVSHLIVNRLLDQHLAHSGIPIRVSIHGGLTMITRDEAGRVRVKGLPMVGPPYREEQRIQEAERILHIVFSKTLKDWGVAQIHTNDASQGPDPKPAKRHA
jgi:hypothetical protein